jgi:NAD-dependent histone deacetylase SIR2
MAHTAHKSDAMMEELRCTDAELDKLATQTADLIRASKHIVFFTGAGISTSAGVPDFRGPTGVWTVASKQDGSQASGMNGRSVNMTSAVATPTHMALVGLKRAGKLQHLISQNVDGLHIRSGIPPGCISELHGNCNTEDCHVCGKRHYRDIHIHSYDGDHHFTRRLCQAADCPEGRLRDTVIGFGEDLPMPELEAAYDHSASADLMICLGSSLTVAPASHMPHETKNKGGKVVIVNFQRTPLDAIADVRVHAPIDDFMIRVMARLGIDIPPFELHRTVTVWKQSEDTLRVAGIVTGDRDAPMALFSSAKLIDIAAGGAPVPASAAQQDHSLDPVGICGPAIADATGATHAVQLEFYGHYREPVLRLPLPREGAYAATYHISWDLRDATWAISENGVFVLPNPALGKGPPRRDAYSAISKRRKSARDGSSAPSVAPAGDASAPDRSSWFAVQPAVTCPHCPSVAIPDGVTIDVHAPCTDCRNVGENMVCLTCWEVHCGRHVHQHMLAHHEATGHPLVCGFVDLSFWCYGCDTYVSERERHLRPIYNVLCAAKFASGDATDPASSPFGAAPGAAGAGATGGGNAPGRRSQQPSAEGVDKSSWFAVQPSATCPHCPSVAIPDGVTIDVHAPCADCGNVGENMVCLTCWEVHCGRHVHQHMLAHHEATGHPLVCGFVDLSFWCYGCDTYVSERELHLRPIYNVLCAAKFAGHAGE